jgi:hypothetical protein
MGEKWPRILLKAATSTSLLGSFTCRKARHGTDGFTSPPNEGVLRPGLNPRTWATKARTLPLDSVEKYCREGQATDDNMAHAHCLLDT